MSNNRFIPNSFQVPNAVIDEYLAKLSGNAFKCYAFIARQTTGWQKQSDRISLSQFMAKCGVKDRRTAIAAIKEVEAVGLILVSRVNGEISEFMLNLNPEMQPVAKNDTSSNSCTQPVAKNDTATSSKKCHSTKDTIKNNITNTTLTGSNAHARTKAKKSDDFEILEKFGIDGELATDFVKHRKALKCPITDTAIKGFEREAGKAGISLREAITIAIERGWKGFKADWQWRDEQPSSGVVAKNPQHSTASTKPNAHVGFAERDYGTTDTPDWAKDLV